MSERLQKVLARAGLGSRREIEGWIQAGRIKVNGVTAELGVQVDGGETISIDGKTVALAPPEATRVIAYHKPLGEITTRSDPEGRPTVFDNLPRLEQGRWITVGRLDISTSGLLLLTNDGELANRLMHPSRQLEREYAVRVFGEVDGLILNALLEGVELEDGPARFSSVRDAGGSGANRWYHVVLGEGRNREVRRLWESQGVQVSRLIRVRYGPIELGRRLPAGTWRDLVPAELAALRDAAGMPHPSPRKPDKPTPRKPAKPAGTARKGQAAPRTARRGRRAQ
jgi:23S rRNA pseudouridine2605 synthase